MKATDLIKSLSLSSITSEDFKVVTLYKGQNPDVFLVDNFGDGRKLYSYNIYYKNPDEKPVSFYFYTRTRIMAFIQHDNEVMNLAAEMQEITQQKPILCLESHAIDAAWTWFHNGGFVNNFISKDPETNLLHLNW